MRRRFALAERLAVERPCARHPPPGGILPSFLMSMWTRSPGRPCSSRRITRPVGRSIHDNRLHPWRTRTRCTVEGTRSSWPSMRAGPFVVPRRSATIRAELRWRLVQAVARPARPVHPPRAVRVLEMPAAPLPASLATRSSAPPRARPETASTGRTSSRRPHSVSRSSRCKRASRELMRPSSQRARSSCCQDQGTQTDSTAVTSSRFVHTSCGVASPSSAMTSAGSVARTATGVRRR